MVQLTVASSQSPAIELKNLTKVFESVVANDGINLTVQAGTIHGVIGENGAGKSTAMKMLYGIYAPDDGQILIDGVVRTWRTPTDAIHAGIGMVHQHFMLSGPETALDNILLGAERPKAGWGFLPQALRPIDRNRAREKLAKISAQYGLQVDLEAQVQNLAVGVQQRIEILKLLFRDAKILILDEPTAVLTPQETQELFVQLKKLKAEGKTIVIITHKLKEVMSFTDRVTVFRSGKVTGEVETQKSSPQELADLMVGRKVLLSVEVPTQKTMQKKVLEVASLSSKGAEKSRLKDLSFQLAAGEILGIAGVEGNGQSELLRALLHPSDPSCRSAGTIRILGKDVGKCSTREIKELGVGVIPEDRHRDGLLLEASVAENYLLGFQRSKAFNHLGFVSYGVLNKATEAAVEEYDVRPRSTEIPIGKLSGGNQQKVIIAREFQNPPKLLIAAQPTRGVDVGAIEFIHKKIIASRENGAGVLLVSSELDEILSLSDRILVMFEGRIVGEFLRGAATEREIGLKMGGGS